MWTDGSADAEGFGGWAFVLRGKVGARPVHVEGSGFARETTNNRMELTAVLHGFYRLRISPMLVYVYSDSQIIIKAFTEGWIERWREEAWKKRPNSDLWIKVDRERNLHDVHWQHVRGHVGSPDNERCDYLANAARRAAREAA
jgi:ribonuclease HI